MKSNDAGEHPPVDLLVEVEGVEEEDESDNTNSSTNNVTGKKNIEDNHKQSHNNRPRYILPLIVVSQFAGTSLWFAGNAVLPDLVEEWNISNAARSYLTSVVQFGFIIGTLLSALTNLADRFQPTGVFLCAAILGAALNALIPFCNAQLSALILLRLLTGVALAGIYPVGMKVAADWFAEGLGRALGWLVGALAVGSAIPFLLRQIDQSWQALLWETSGLAAMGGIAVGCLVPDGPHRKPATRLNSNVVWTLFADNPPFRSAAMSYWCHMWELYAFWTWCPAVWEAYFEQQSSARAWDASAITFGVIAMGGLGCVLGGLLSVRFGSAMIAFASLAVSGSLCLLSPALYQAPPMIMLIAYLIWGMAVVADSPQFSSLVATTAPATNKGTALTIVNCIGFAVTIASIELLGVPLGERYLFLLLAPGPMLGLWCMRDLVSQAFRNQPVSVSDGRADQEMAGAQHNGSKELEITSEDD